MKALNRFLVAYHLVDSVFTGHKPPWPFRLDEFLDYASLRVVFVIPPDRALTDPECLRALECLPAHKKENSFQIASTQLHDLPIFQTRERISENLRLQETFIHYELAFESQAKMRDGDAIGALLLAVAALEGAHGAFVQHELSNRLPEPEDGSSDKFIENLGMTLCNKITPYIFSMSEDERPEREAIEGATDALKFRNEIMHALRKNGAYRMRNRKEEVISKAYRDLIRVYRCYVHALETRLKENEM